MSEPYTPTHIVHITDTTDRNAEMKVRSAYVLHRGRIGLRDATVDFAPATNTVEIGIVASELLNNSQRPDRLILALNCAPPDKSSGTTDNARNDFFCAKLSGETFVSGTSNGHEFSYIKNEIEEMFRLTVTNSKKSQFRSLEILPEFALQFSDPEKRADLIRSGVLERVTDIDQIVASAPLGTRVSEVDNFKNVKIFPSATDLALLRAEEGRWVDFAFGTVRNEVTVRPHASAMVAPTLFAAPLDTNVIALRSSSRRFDGDTHVPIIATIRDLPAETSPLYPIPDVGSLVKIFPRSRGRIVSLAS